MGRHLSPPSSKTRGDRPDFWRRFVITRSQDTDQAHQEYMTKVVLALIGCVLLPATILILFFVVIGVFDWYPLEIIVTSDAIIALSWWLADRGYWRKIRYFPVVLFFLVGVYITENNGLVTVLMGYIIAIVLAAFLLGNREQWFLVVLSTIVHFGLGWYRHPLPLNIALPTLVMAGSTFVGIALLQSLALNQLHHALAKSRSFSVELQDEIAERKRMEQALKLSEEQYRLVVENQGEGVVFVDPEENFTFANPASESIFGVPAGGLVGCNLEKFTSPEEFARILEQTQRRRSGEKSSYEVEITRQDGEQRILLVTATPLFQDGGVYTGAFGVLRDITDRKQAEAALQRYANGMEALNETTLEINAQIELPTLLQAIVQRAAGLVGTPTASLFLMATGGDTLEMVISTPRADGHPTVRVGEGPIGRVAQTGDPFNVENFSYLGEETLGRAMGVPLKQGGKVIGVLTMQDYYPGKFTEDEFKLVSLFADQAAMAIEKARLYAEVQRLATADEVTGLLNRRGLWDFGRREFERARRFNRPLAAIFLDIDHFKHVNDTYGHGIGDQALRILGERLKSNTREVDLVARYGGEEFVILLPEVDTAIALLVAERLRRCTVDVPMVTDQGPVKISISLGVVQNWEEVHDLAMLIDLADQAMFMAKQNGRNRVEVMADAQRNLPD